MSRYLRNSQDIVPRNAFENARVIDRLNAREELGLDSAAPATSSPVDERKNRFQKHNENKKTARNATAKRDAEERAAHQEETIARRHNLKPDTYTATSGIAMDEKTLAARDAWLAEKEAAKNPATTAPATRIGREEAAAIYRAWVTANPSFPASPYNGLLLSHILVAFKLPCTFDSLTKAYQYAVENNHIEPNERKRGQPAPVPFELAPVAQPSTAPADGAVTITPAEMHKLGLRHMIVQTDDGAAEKAAAKAMPFDELQKKARSDRNRSRDYNPRVAPRRDQGR